MKNNKMGKKMLTKKMKMKKLIKMILIEKFKVQINMKIFIINSRYNLSLIKMNFQKNKNFTTKIFNIIKIKMIKLKDQQELSKNKFLLLSQEEEDLAEIF